MRQMKMEGLRQVSIDYESGELPKSIQELRPALYKDDNTYCCILGPSRKEGIFASGETEIEALENWDRHLNERLLDPMDNDETVQFVLDNIAAKQWVIW